MPIFTDRLFSTKRVLLLGNSKFEVKIFSLAKLGGPLVFAAGTTAVVGSYDFEQGVFSAMLGHQAEILP